MRQPEQKIEIADHQLKISEKKKKDVELFYQRTMEGLSPVSDEGRNVSKILERRENLKRIPCAFKFYFDIGEEREAQEANPNGQSMLDSIRKKTPSKKRNSSTSNWDKEKKKHVRNLSDDIDKKKLLRRQLMFLEAKGAYIK